MCGIAGWVDYRRDVADDPRTIDAMTESMTCRGPDAEGVWTDRHVALGHRRLAVIDVDGGTQPMTAEVPGGFVSLTYSGEAYNSGELRRELSARGHQFRTDSDTEVVLRGYIEWGDALAERLNGMYAFAVWDTRTERLALVRDRMGIKPLYYYPTESGVIFGSEPKAILANPLSERSVDLDGFRELFGFTRTPGHAFWSGMHEVRPGTVLTFDRSGRREHVYWQLTARHHEDDQDSSVAHVRELLEDIVNRQVVSDVPRCSLLSGGLDSSAITALAAASLREHGERINTFAIDFKSQAENFVPDAIRGTPDAPYVADMVEHLDVEHTDIVLDHKELADPEIRAAVVAARDMPIGLGDMDNSLYLLFREIRRHSTVALSGESADEVFGGYRWFHDAETRWADNFPWINSLGVGHWARSPLLRPELAESLDVESYVADSYRSALRDVPRLDSENGVEARMRELCYLHLSRFVQYLLDRKDRTSMATGLEVRVPFCDHRLVEYVFNTPWSLKTFDSKEKSLLRSATADLLPDSVAQRTKSPYPSTQDDLYVGELQRQTGDVLADPNDRVNDLINGDWFRPMTNVATTKITTPARNDMERLLDLSVWLKQHSPELKFQ